MVLLGRAIRHWLYDQDLHGVFAARGPDLGDLTPIPLIIVSIALNEVVRRFMHAPRKCARRSLPDTTTSAGARADDADQSRVSDYAIKGFFDDRSSERLGLPG